MPTACSHAITTDAAPASSVHDVLSPGPPHKDVDAPDGALVGAAQRLAEDVLRPSAEVTDQARVIPRTRLNALAEIGLSGLFGPPESGGTAAPLSVTRPIFETIAGACGVTFFVWAQHHAPIRLLGASDNADLKEVHLRKLCSGSQLGGVAFGYLRRPGPPTVTATAVDGGFRIDGVAPWVSSWGVADIFAVAARIGTDAVFFVISGRPTKSLATTGPLNLAVMNASSTVRLSFKNHFVRDDDVISVVPFEHWIHDDIIATAKPNPAPFGVAATCCRLLEPHDPVTASAFTRELDDCRQTAYQLTDDDESGPEHLDRLVAARAWSLGLAARAARALVASAGGQAMLTTHPGQRLLREAAFYMVQAQTAALRTMSIQRLLSQ